MYKDILLSYKYFKSTLGSVRYLCFFHITNSSWPEILSPSMDSIVYQVSTALSVSLGCPSPVFLSSLPIKSLIHMKPPIPLSTMTQTAPLLSGQLHSHEASCLSHVFLHQQSIQRSSAEPLMPSSLLSFLPSPENKLQKK